MSPGRQTVWILSTGGFGEGGRIVKVWSRKPSNDEVLAVLPRQKWIEQVDTWIHDGDWANLEKTEVAS